MRHRDIIIDWIRAYNIKVMAEIGVYQSRSTRVILRSEPGQKLDQYWAIDPWKIFPDKPKMRRKYTQASYDQMYFNACQYMPVFHSLRVVRLESVDAALLFPDLYFDLVFIDAAHDEESVTADNLAWLPKVKRGGIIAGHDYGVDRKRGFGVEKAVNQLYGKQNVKIFDDRVWAVGV